MRPLQKVARVLPRRGAAPIVAPPPPPPPVNTWLFLPYFLSNLAGWSGFGSSAADSTYTGVSTPVTTGQYYDSINGNNSNSGSFSSPKKTPFASATAQNNFTTGGVKIGILTNSSYAWSTVGHGSDGSAMMNFGANGISIVGIDRNTGLEVQPPRNQFDNAKVGSWVSTAEKESNYWFLYGNSNTATGIGGLTGFAFNANTFSPIIRNVWAEGFSGFCKAAGNASNFAATIEDFFADYMFYPGNPGTGWFVRIDGRGVIGWRLAGGYSGGNIGEDLIWQQAGGGGVYNWVIRDCALRHWCVSSQNQAAHCDWMQSASYMGNSLMQRVIGEHQLKQGLVTGGNGRPIGCGGILMNSNGSQQPETVRNGGTFTDVFLCTNSYGTNFNSASPRPTGMTRTRFGIGIHRTLPNVDNTGANIVIAGLHDSFNDQRYTDSNCRMWYDNPRYAGDVWADGYAPSNITASGGGWTHVP